jgi:hypothetical protein
MADEEALDAAMSDGGAGTGDDDSSSEEEVELSPADETAVMTLESQLESAPAVYDTHVQVWLMRVAAADAPLFSTCTCCSGTAVIPCLKNGRFDPFLG